MEKRFIVKNLVSDYAVFDTKHLDEDHLVCICQGKRNADLIADILNTDYSKPNECTYYENELRQENKQLEEQHDLLIDEFQKERENLCKQIKKESDARKRFVEKVKQLKEQLAEKDEEIEEYKTQIKEFCGTKLAKLIDKKEQEIRKQVCDEIREKLPYYEYSFQEPEVPRVNVIEIRDIEFILDQIEQAKESMK